MFDSPSSQLLDEEFAIEYVGEGAANVVFRLRRPGSRLSARQLQPQRSWQSEGCSSCEEDDERPGSLRQRYSSVRSDFNARMPAVTNCAVHPAQSLAPSPAPPARHALDAELPLVRLRKDLATVTPILDAHQNYQQMILPNFDRRHLIASALATLPAGFIERCNARLREMEQTGARPKKRRGQYLARQPYANLVQDMSPRDASDTVIEFKLKWLAQSPSAPADAKRCRTCAMRAMRAAADASKSSSGGQSDNALPADASFCPLDLADRDNRACIRGMLGRQFRQALHPSFPEVEVQKLSRVTADHLAQSGIIEQVRRLQVQMDPTGILSARIDEEFLMAMTLRDCTLFIRVDDELNVEARLGDIDLKPATKSSYWRVTEERLIGEGWYTCKEDGGDGVEAICFLSPQRTHIS